MAPPVHLTFLGGLGEIGRDLAAVEGQGDVVRRVRDRVDEVEVGLHDALIRLRPATAGRASAMRPRLTASGRPRCCTPGSRRST